MAETAYKVELQYMNKVKEKQLMKITHKKCELNAVNIYAQNII